ncbi:uncharacterized protein LOC110238309 [Exaiptasia diaphana]|uniref:Nucleolar protein Dnt1-like N-terminal domain-containing protein n=1 Tax=Exaiptasia diaphana TaxID=2652724 RepID=A0A913X6B5_EXADI|nr:uncharacterized protein LOC110238309 [Exaiptasia diaphana]KXJ28611.1 Nucleolar protein dnt1 [Exaiptasia diaphana]
MASKLRLHVVCTSRDKRFLVLADENWCLEDVKECIELVFLKLYPSEQTLKVCKLQNEFHFDLPLDYCVGDTLTDAGLLFAIEEDQKDDRNPPSILPGASDLYCQKNTKKPERKNKVKSPRRASKRKISTGSDGDGTSSNAVTSTTDSPLSSVKDCIENLMPQVIERVPCEDCDVDIETLED